MSFNDEDLKRLKFNLENHAPNWFDKDNLVGLIARMEAAEIAIWASIALDDSIALGSSSDIQTHQQFMDQAKAAMEAWRKAAGK